MYYEFNSTPYARSRGVHYHLLLENNDDEERFGIWANGILTETPNEKTVK